MADGEIISFYSFKGGVGRTMALVNVAYVLARKTEFEVARSFGVKKKVLMIDWDLESPGLHYYLYREGLPTTGKKGLAQLLIGLGLSDLLRNGSNDRRLANLDSVLKSTKWEEYFHKVEETNPDSDLWFMPHSSSDAGDYHNDLLRLDWRLIDDLAPWALPLIVRHMTKLFDYVLIDSRTGMSDTGFLSGGLIPDKMVFVFTHNRQSSTGARPYFNRMLSLRSENVKLGIGSELGIFPLPSMVQDGIPYSLRDWYDNETYGIGARLNEFLRQPGAWPNCWDRSKWLPYLSQHYIPYVPEVAFGDHITTKDIDQDETHPLSLAYLRFTELLRTHRSPWELSDANVESRIGTLKPTPATERREVAFTDAARHLELMVDSQDTRALIGSKNVQAIKSVCDALKYEELGPRIVGICRTYASIASDASDLTSRWNSIWHQYAREVLDDTDDSLVKLANRELPEGFTSANQGFWSTELWKRTGKSVWTTNVATVGQSFGRRLDMTAIALQGEAVKRGVPVTRIFVLEPDETPDSRIELQNIIKAQYHAGISVFVVARAIFDLAKDDVVEELGSEDFMIVDDLFIYVTERKRSLQGGSESTKKRIQILNSGAKLRLARTYQREIEAKAIQIRSVEEISELIPVCGS